MLYFFIKRRGKCRKEEVANPGWRLQFIAVAVTLTHPSVLSTFTAREQPVHLFLFQRHRHHFHLKGRRRLQCRWVDGKWQERGPLGKARGAGGEEWGGQPYLLQQLVLQVVHVYKGDGVAALEDFHPRKGQDLQDKCKVQRNFSALSWREEHSSEPN